ncbi:zinc-dependent metalloprotease [Falsarthrobacter nasiphocae]
MLPARVSAAVSRALTPSGPRVRVEEAREVVSRLRVLAPVAAAEVARITGLPAARALTSEVRVVDREAWTAAALASFEHLSGAALRRGLEGASPVTLAVGGVSSGVQSGAILSILATRVLGQFDPFTPGHPDGALLLVAPNIEAVRSELTVDPDDFSLWVLLHEQTHRVQFAAAPWLKAHMEARVAELMESVVGEAESLSRDLANLQRALERARRGRREGVPVSELFLPPQARAIMSELTGVMSFLEGHANLVMDAVDASTVPTVKTIRRRFTERAANRSGVERVLLRWIGMEKKAAQYRDGQRFCEAIHRDHGMGALNRVFERAEHLPSEAEIHEPSLWAARVLGVTAP